MIKRLICIIFAALVTIFFCSCKDDSNKTQLVVFAASSMTESLNDVKYIFEEAHPDVEIIYNFDSSGTLKTQIEHGATCDVFISASQTPMDRLDITADASVNTDSLNYILSDTRLNLLQNNIVLAVSPNSNIKVKSFDDMYKRLVKGEIFMAIGNIDVPAGEYAHYILQHYGLSLNDIDKERLLTYGSNAKEITAQISENVVDCGIVFKTDAQCAGLQIVDIAGKDICPQAVYPAAVINRTEQVTLAKTFLEFLNSQKSSLIFEKYGFTVID